MMQYLVLVTKDTNDKVTTRQMMPVAFVPFTGKH
jgi:protein-L-isoaspartate(D-aspartate) O-methyltransferase